jgi:hypothetical protein
LEDAVSASADAGRAFDSASMRGTDALAALKS